MTTLPQPVPHGMTIAADEADFEREMFCRDLNLFLETRLRPRIKTIYESRVRPELLAKLGREPNRREIAKAMREIDVNKLWYQMRTLSQRAAYERHQLDHPTPAARTRGARSVVRRPARLARSRPGAGGPALRRRARRP